MTITDDVSAICPPCVPTVCWQLLNPSDNPDCITNHTALLQTEQQDHLLTSGENINEAQHPSGESYEMLREGLLLFCVRSTVVFQYVHFPAVFNLFSNITKTNVWLLECYSTQVFQRAIHCPTQTVLNWELLSGVRMVQVWRPFVVQLAKKGKWDTTCSTMTTGFSFSATCWKYLKGKAA